MAFLDAEQLSVLGLGAFGTDVLIDEAARIIAPGRLRLGSHVRIDACAVLSAGAGGIVVGNHVHIAAHCFLGGSAPIELGDFCGISGRTSIYSSTDDFSGDTLTGPTVADSLRAVTSARVRVGRHVIIGAGTVVLPGVELADGGAVGAMSLIREDVPEFAIVAGVPARRIGTRRRGLLELEQRLAERDAIG